MVDWIRRIRTSGSAGLRDTPILVRPHPSRRPEWEGIDLTPFAEVVVWGSDPVSADARADYFDSLFHSAVVVGLNTSAFIEAGILGRPVHTILLPEWYESQMGTVHFRYLFEAGGGLLTSATSFDEHLQQLDEVARASIHRGPAVRARVRAAARSRRRGDAGLRRARRDDERAGRGAPRRSRVSRGWRDGF